ncbi:MAG TPA: hypothetical protein VF384_10905 [Planctomycetota bacterium]
MPSPSLQPPRALLLVGLGGFVAAQQAPAAITDGPLICFTVPRGADGKRDSVFFAANVEGQAPAREFFRSKDNASVLQRLDRDHLLVASYGSPYGLLVVDLTAGTPRELAPGAPHAFVAVHGDDVLHLGDPREPANDNFLYATPWRVPGERRRLADVRLASVPLVQGNLAIGLTKEHEVWVVSLTRAQGRRLWTPPPDASWVRVCLSPAGQRLAIGSVEANGRGRLTVVDSSTGELVRTVADLPIQVSALSSSLPVLEVGWRDDNHVVCSETRGDQQGLRGTFVFVTRNLASGEVTDETAYSDLGLSHEAPPVPGAAAMGRPSFEIAVDGGQSVLRAVGTKKPLAAVELGRQQYQDLCVSHDGRAAAARVGDHRSRFVLFTPGSDTPRELAKEWVCDVTWLPASK